MTPEAFIVAHSRMLISVRNGAIQIGQSLPSLALALLDERMPLCAEVLIPRARGVCFDFRSNGSAQAFALPKRQLAEILRLDGVPIDGPAPAFPAIADLVETMRRQHPLIVCVTQGAIVLRDVAEPARAVLS